MNVIDLVRRFKNNGIDISLRGNDLEVHYEGEDLPETILGELKANKPVIIAFLKQMHTEEPAGIPAAPPQSSYPLSSSQRRIWLMSQLDEGSVIYNTPSFYEFEGDLNLQALEYSFRTLIARHEIMRTVFKEDEQGEIRQFINSPEDTPFRITCQDLRNRKNRKKVIKGLLQNEFNIPFNLSSGPLLRTCLCQVEDNKWVFTYTLHHIISDGWSMNLFINELLIFYNAFCRGEINPLPPLPVQYKDYATWQQAQLSGEQLQSHKLYWLKQFEGELPVLELPADRVRPAVKTYRGEAVYLTINPQLTRGIKLICQDQGATLFMGLLAAFNVLLYRYTHQNDIIIGSPIAGRDHIDLENQIGVYLNTLAFRTRFEGEDNFKELLGNIRQVTFGAYEHSVYPFDELIESLDLPGDRSRNTLFNVIIGLHNHRYTIGRREMIEGLKVGRYEGVGDLNSEFDLSFDFVEAGEALSVTIKYNSDIYNKDTIERMAGHFEQLLGAIIEQPSKPIQLLDYLDIAEKRKLLVEFNDTAADYPRNKTLVDLFEEVVLKDPEGVALIFNQQSFSRTRLNEKANQLANYLRSVYKITAGDTAAIKLVRSEWMIISILGILKSGAAYVPIDPEYPRERIDYILADSCCKVVIDEERIAAFLAEETKYSKQNPTPVNRSTDLAYVIYTSGSTGKPKGCMLEHRGVVNRIEWMWQYYGFDSQDIILQKTTFTFDVSVWELFLPLCWGARMVLCQNEDIGSPERILSLLEKEKITCVHFVPGMLNAFMAYFSDYVALRDRLRSLERVIVSGEALAIATVTNWYDRTDIPIHNLYGPTEASVDVTFFATSSQDKRILIGRPIWNTQMYIIGKENQLAAIGVIGEICIGGDGLARGYLNQPDLTVEKFVTNPFKEGVRIYRTGDLGRWLTDGNIEFTGRKDDQVKIRGYRIELGEITNTLLGHTAVKEAIVLVKNDPGGDKHLVAYYVPVKEDNDLVDPGNQLQVYISGKLPSYMVPGYYVQLDSLPLTPNGKINTKALPDPEGLEEGRGVEYVAPGNKTEERLVLIWQDVLGKEKVGIKDNFFSLGGHSLKAIRLANQIHKSFDVKVELKELFAKRVLEEQARLIEQTKKTSFTTILPVELQSNYPLSSSQRRLWVLSQFEQANVAYNMPGVYVFEGDLDAAGLEFSFKKLLERHESLRTIFKEDEQEEIKQFIHKPEEVGFRIAYRDFRQEPNSEKLIRDLIREECFKPFDLASGPLLRAGLFQTADNKWLFTYVMHHIISDGWSMGILIDELLLFYNAYINGENLSLLALRIQYKDYAFWQQEQLRGEQLKSHKQYWLNQFEGELPVLELIGDKVRPAVKTHNGGVIHKTMNRKTCAGIRELSREAGGTLFMGLLAVVNTLLYGYTGQEDIIIGTPIAGRDHADLEGQIGSYVNTLALRTRFEGGDSFREILEKVRQVTLGAYEHQVYPFDELVDTLNLQRDMSRNPLFDVMVMLQNTGTDAKVARPGTGDVSISYYQDGEYLTSKFDLTFSFVEREEEIQTSIEYNSDIYTKYAVDQLAEHLELILEAVLQEPSLPIGQLDYLSKVEKHRLLVEFNDTKADYTRNRTIVDLFEEQAEKTPDRIAVVFKGTKLTYQELNERSNQLGDYLKQNYNIREDDLIGIKLDRSQWLIITILGVLKSGGAYVPIDPEYPQEWIEHAIADSKCTAVIDDEEIGKFKKERRRYAKKNGSAVKKPDGLAYVIYTSGSTGKPKGVMVGLEAVRNLVTTQKMTFGIDSEENVLQFSTISFDASVEQIFIAITSGSCLTIVDKETILDPEKLEEFISENKITHVHMVPDILQTLRIRKYENLRRVISGGDRCPKELAERWSEHHRFYNEYGPTETTITSIELLYNQCDQIRSVIPIGRPVANTCIYILRGKQLTPVGVPGEICISGVGLARGYLNLPVLTAEKFTDNPFREGERLYRTGDMGRWLADGNIEFLGRKDDQVKIRGYRIELEEIERALLSLQDIDSAVVATKLNREGEKELVAYVVGKEQLNSKEIRSGLAMRLPGYMLPGHFIQLERIPLTSTGKVDRRSLPEPDGLNLSTGVEYIAPRNEIEGDLALVWQEVLGVEKAGVKDNFFDLGGHSLKATRLASRIFKEFEVKITLKELFTHAILEDQARLLGQTVKTSFNINAFVQDSLLNEVSYNQLDYLSEYEFGNDIVIIYDQIPDLNIDAFTAAIRQLTERHEALRTVFLLADGIVKQKVIPVSELDFIAPTVTAIKSDDEMKLILEKEYFRKMNPYIPPLCIVKVYDQGNGIYHILFTIHHIIIDAYSIGILKDELKLLYLRNRGEGTAALEPLPFQYRDFSGWQRSFIDSVEGEQHREYWLNKLKGFDQRIYLPSSKENMNTRGNKIIVTGKIEGELLAKADLFIREHGLTRPVLLMGSLILLLNQLGDQQDITLITSASGRNSTYYEGTNIGGLIGYFVNHLLVRNIINKETVITDYLKEVQNNFLDDLNYDAYPFSKLIYDLPGIVPSDFLRSTAFFNFHNYSYLNDAAYIIEEEEVEIDYADSIPFSLGIAVSEYKNCLAMQLIFNKNDFHPEHALEIKDLYFSILRYLLYAPQLLIRQIKERMGEKSGLLTVD